MGLFDKIIDAQRYSGNAKATIQANGRLGFSSDAANMLSLTSDSKLLFSQIDKDNLVFVECAESDNRAFHVQKGGEYYYIKMKGFFDSMDIDYTGPKRVIYDVAETTETYNGKPVFKLSKRTKKGDNDDDENILN